MEFNFETLIFDENLDPEQIKWDALVEAAMAGNVVPVIGPDFLCEYPDRKNVNQIIISIITKSLGLKHSWDTYSQLVYDPEFYYKLRERRFPSTDVIYSLVDAIVDNKQYQEHYFKPSAVLKRLLEIKLFPFVITTSFVPVVENVMKEVWGADQVKVMQFINNPQNDLMPGEGDIKHDADMAEPTVYYMFGKSSKKANSYVLTDNNMLDFCRTWLSEQTRPNNLCSVLKNKYLLMLGCGYSDWLFRFIWFSMNKKSGAETLGMMVKDDSIHEDLVAYLKRIDTFLPENKDSSQIVDEIEKRINEQFRINQEKEWLKTPPKKEIDVFISYSRRDSEVAEKLYQYLCSIGLSVWYDRTDLLGGHQFMAEIMKAIMQAKTFVPILSSNIEEEAMDAHVYRHEWEKAVEQQTGMGSQRRYIIPINEVGFDFYAADIPEKLKAHNAICYGDSRNLDFSKVGEAIKAAIKMLNDSKKL